MISAQASRTVLKHFDKVKDINPKIFILENDEVGLKSKQGILFIRLPLCCYGPAQVNTLEILYDYNPRTQFHAVTPL